MVATATEEKNYSSRSGPLAARRFFCLRIFPRSMRCVAWPMWFVRNANAGGLIDHHKRQQQPREQEPGKVIDGEAQLIAILTDLPFRSGAARANASIVDEEVETIVNVSSLGQHPID